MNLIKSDTKGLVICVILTVCTNLNRKVRLKIKEYTKAIKLETNDNIRAEAYINRGKAYGIKKRYYSKIFADYTQAIALATKNETRALAYKHRAIVHSWNRQPEKAIADYTQAIALFRDDNEKANVYERRGAIYRDAKQYSEAEYDYIKSH